MESILNAQVYCGTYKKYNEGNLYGKWIRLSDYTTKRKFLDGCKELHFDERSPEFMYQDVENLPDGLYSESYLPDEIWHVINSLKKFAPDRADEFAQWCDDNGAEQDYKALREFLNFKPKAENGSNKKTNTMSRTELRKLIEYNGGRDTEIEKASSAHFFGDKLVVFMKPTIKTSFCYDDENEAALENYNNFTEQISIDENLLGCQEQIEDEFEY